MTANIVTPGHIKCLELLRNKGFVTVGLLTARALKGYKKELVPYKDREFVLDTIGIAVGAVQIVPQDSLDPLANIKKYGCDTIASGDGFEKQELAAIKKLKLNVINVRLHGEKGKKRYSSSAIIKKAK